MPELSIPVAMGLYLIAAQLTHQDNGKDTDFDKIGKSIIQSLLKPFIAIGFGYLYLQFI